MRKAAFIGALLRADRAAASDALMQMRRERWSLGGMPRHRPALTPVQRAKRRLKVEFVGKMLRAFWAQRDEELRGVFRPPPTPEQVAEAHALAERLKRWLKDDRTATPFE